MSGPLELLARLGAAVRGSLADIGDAARLLLRLLALVPAALARLRLVSDQIHFLGNHSLAIIGVSGLFVGFVLGLQGYYTLQVPIGALFRDGAGWAVFVVESGRARLRAVTIGHQTDLAAEITAGLAEGAQVIAFPGARIAEGSRVTAAPGG